MAFIIREVNKGPIATLEDLGLINTCQTKHPKPNLSQCQAALEYMYGVVCDVVQEEHREKLYVDYIMLEHSFCEFSRVTLGGWLQS